MNAADTQAAVAAALADPLLLESWRIGACPRPIALAEIDLEVLRAFAGLGYKVRHNGLRVHLAGTFRVMRTLGLELELFAAYALSRARAGLPLRPGDFARMRDLMGFIDQWRLPDLWSHNLLWDLLRHETAVADLMRNDLMPECLGVPLKQAAAERVCIVNGRLVLHDFTYDPRRIASSSRSEEALRAIEPKRCSVGYWRAPASQHIERVELDAFSSALLEAVDGRCTLDMLSHRVLGSPATPAFLAMSQQLAALGLIVAAEVIP